MEQRWALQRRAGFAKGGDSPPKAGVTPPAATAGLQRGGMRIVMFSPNVRRSALACACSAPERSDAAPPGAQLIAEPYKGPRPSLPLLSLFTAAGWRERWQRLLGRVKNVYALAKVKKDVPNWTLPSFKTEACELYRQVCAAIAAGDQNALRHVTTESLLTALKREIKQREAGGWARVEWSLEALEECAVVHGRLVAPNPKDTSVAWAQLTVALRSTQRFSAYDARGKRVAGDPDTPVRVQDYWVFERALMPGTPDGMKRWRAAARITLPQAKQQLA